MPGRRMTLSTVGVLPALERLATEPLMLVWAFGAAVAIDLATITVQAKVPNGGGVTSDTLALQAGMNSSSGDGTNRLSATSTSGAGAGTARESELSGPQTLGGELCARDQRSFFRRDARIRHQTSTKQQQVR